MKNNKPAFTLVELMMVVVVIIILAAIGIPSYLKSKNKAKQKEAIANIGLIAAAERIYRLEYGDYVSCADYGTCNSTLKLMLNGNNWAYSVATAGSAGSKTATIDAISGSCTYSLDSANFDGTPTGSGC